MRFDFSLKYPPIDNVPGRELLSMAESDPECDIIQDMRLRYVGFILNYQQIRIEDIITNYVELLAHLTNQNLTITLQNQEVEVLRSIGYILAFAAPTPLSTEITRYESKLVKHGVPFIKERAFHPDSTFTQHYPDIWVNKIDAAKLLNWEGDPAEITSSDLVQFLSR